MATRTVESKVKNKEKDLKKATDSSDLDKILDNIKKIDNTCCYTKCKKRTSEIGIDCKYCNNRFCTTHVLPEIHGCDEAVKKDAQQKFLHPYKAPSDEKHNQAANKLTAKLKQMQFERKAKQYSNKSKK